MRVRRNAIEDDFIIVRALEIRGALEIWREPWKAEHVRVNTDTRLVRLQGRVALLDALHNHRGIKGRLGGRGRRSDRQACRCREEETRYVSTCLHAKKRTIRHPPNASTYLQPPKG